MAKCCDVKIGELRWPIKVQQSYGTKDAFGGYQGGSWTDVFGTKAKVETKVGRERVYGEKIEAPTVTVFTIRYRPDYDPATWNRFSVLFRERRFNIQYTRELGNAAKRFIEIVATENTPS